MRLLHLSISERRGEPARQLDFGREKGGVGFVAITGPEGSGKTSTLEAIALHKEHLAPYNAQPSVTDFTGERSRDLFEIESEWKLDESEVAETGSDGDVIVGKSRFQDGIGTTEADPALAFVLGRFHTGDWVPKVDLFPESRLGPPRGAAAGDPTTWQRMYRLGLDTKKYAGLSRLLLEADERLAAGVGELLGQICPGLRLLDDRLTFGTSYGQRRLGKLSLSQRLSFELAATFVLVGLKRSVVMIDGIERGFPAGAALRVVQALQSYAPDTQLIVTTHDHALLTLPEGKTIHLERS
ncbi:MAG: hypothetical protein RIF41_37085 [Polyangiaceae bacterium]